MAIVPATTTARSSRIPSVAPFRSLPGASVSQTPNNPPAVAATTAARGSVKVSVRLASPSVASVTIGASRRVPVASPVTRQPEADQRAENEEESNVGGAGEAGLTDGHELGRVDGEGGHGRRQQAGQSDGGR